MKQNKNYSEEDLQNLLQNMPEVEDRQTSDELYQKISSRLNSVEPEKNPFYKQPWMIATVSAAAVLIFLITTLSWVFDGTYNTADQGAESTNEDANIQEKQESSSKSPGEAEDNSDSGGSTEDQAGISSIAPQEEDESKESNSENAQSGDSSEENDAKMSEIGGNRKLEQSYVFLKRPHDQFATVAVIGANSKSVIPVTVIAPPNWGSVNEVYNSISKSVRAKDWGVQEYAFKDVQFNIKKDQNSVIADFPKGYTLPQGKAQEENFLTSLREMFRPHGIETIKLQKNGNEGLSFENLGEKKEVSIQELSNKAYLLYQKEENKPAFLTPVSLDDKNIENALNTMKNGLAEKTIKPVIPKSVSLEFIEKKGKTLQLTFSEDTTFGEQPVAMIEAIFMTAKSFGYTEVKLNNAPNQHYGRYNLNETVQVPDLLNPQPFNYPPGTGP